MNDLQKIHQKIRLDVKRRKEEFQENWNRDSMIQALLYFSLCTPQSSATRSWNALNEFLPRVSILTESQIAEILGRHGVRFKYNKARYIIECREKFKTISLRSYIDDLLTQGVVSARNELAKTIRGIGMKEASHFLRNIGYGDEVCILDRHILRNLEKYDILKTSKTLTPKLYLEYEEKMKTFAKKLKIPVFDLDFVFWYNNNGELPVY